MTDRPKIAPPIIENIPAELKARAQWVCWRYEWVVNKQNVGKWTKVPYGARDYKAATNRPTSWQPFQKAWQLYTCNQDHFDGIGYVFSADDPYVGGDIDHCITDSEISEAALAILPNTYAEISPSGTGIKFIVRSNGRYGRKTAKGELYSSLRFFTITGRVIPWHTEITECQESVDLFLASLGNPEKTTRAGKSSNKDRAQLAAEHTPEEWAEARREQRTNISRLLGELHRRSVSNKTGRRDTQLAYLLREDYTGFHNKWPYVGIVRGDGTIDSSQIRAVMANAIKGRGFGFPQFVALMSHFYGHECLEKWKFNKQSVQEEFANLWDISRTPRTGEYKARTEPVKRGKGSDHTILVERAYQALVDYKAGAQAFLSQQDLADALGIHRRTALTLMQELRDAGRISYVAMRDNAGLVVSFGDVINGDIKSGNSEHNNGTNKGKETLEINAAPVFEGVINQDDEFAFTDAEIADPTAFMGAELEVGETQEGVINEISENAELSSTDVFNSMGVLSEERENESPISIINIYNPVSLSVGSITPPPSLPDLARHYLEQPAVLVGERLINQETGVVTYRRSSAHFAGLVAGEYDADRAIAAYRLEQERKRREEKAAWERFFSQLKKMSNDELIAYIAGGCRRSVAELSRDAATFDQHLYKTRLNCAKRHLEWRGIQMPEREVRQKAVTPKKREEQHVIAEQLTLEEIPPVSLPSDQPTAAGMIERLKALKRQKEDTQFRGLTNAA